MEASYRESRFQGALLEAAGRHLTRGADYFGQRMAAGGVLPSGSLLCFLTPSQIRTPPIGNKMTSGQNPCCDAIWIKDSALSPPPRRIEPANRVFPFVRDTGINA